MDNRELEMRALYYKAMEDYKTPGRDAHEEAQLFLEQASDLGSAEAQKMLGILYMSGQYSPWPEKDMTKSVRYLEMAGNNGDEEAMYWVSQFYETGMGVEQDPEKAAAWKQKALDAGFEPEEESGSGEADGTTPEEQDSSAADIPAGTENSGAAASQEQNRQKQGHVSVFEKVRKWGEGRKPVPGRVSLIGEPGGDGIVTEPDGPVENARPAERPQYFNYRAAEQKDPEKGRRMSRPAGALSSDPGKPSAWQQMSSFGNGPRDGSGAEQKSVSESGVSADPGNAQPGQETASRTKENIFEDSRETSGVRPASEIPSGVNAAEEWNRFEQETKREADRREQKLPLQYALSFGGGAGGVLLLISLVLFLMFHNAETQSSAIAIVYWVVAVLLSLGIGGFAGWMFKATGTEKAQKENRWALSAFHYGFRGSVPEEDSSSWIYEIYSTLERTFLPARAAHTLNRETLTGASDVQRSGILLPGWIFCRGGEFARPEFVICTYRGVYVVRCYDRTGWLSGDFTAPRWSLRTEAERTSGEPGTVRSVPNLMEENDYAVEIVRRELENAGSFGSDRIPFGNVPIFNVLLFPQTLDIRGIRFAGAPQNVLILQGGAEKLRGTISRMEMFHPEIVSDRDALCDAIDSLAALQPQRQMDLPRLAGGEEARTSFHALDPNEF